jgi:predicted metal-binding membrane protein
LASVARPATSVLDRQALFRRYHPEWWIGLLAGAAWVFLIWTHTAELTMLTGSVMPDRASPTPGRELADWALMAGAMMLPLALPALQFTALNSLRFRRQRAMSLFLVAYTSIWLGFGIVAILFNWLMVDIAGISQRLLLVEALAIAGFWQVSRPKMRALNSCSRAVSLRPLGLRADLSCVHYGVQTGWRCLRSCWALMMVLAFVGHGSLLWMVAVSAFIIAEELTSVGLRLQRPSGFILMAAAVVVGLLSLLL